MVLADLHSNTLFFDPIFGGDPIFWDPFVSTLKQKDFGVV